VENPFEPQLGRRDLPAETIRLRDLADEQMALITVEIQEGIDAHLAAYRHVVDSLIHTHEEIAERSDIDLEAETRWVATWELSGRCLAVSRVLLHDLQGGFAAEAVGTLRALHEAVQLLSALAFHLEDDAARCWLAGEWIRPKDARKIQGRKQELALERMAEAGIEPEGGDIMALGQEIYSHMSESAHHQRGGFRESVAVALRRFAYGPHPDPTVRAAWVDYAGELLEEVTLVVGDAFADMVGREYMLEYVRPLQASLVAVRESYPLSDH
jgi:hypothetical protein